VSSKPRAGTRRSQPEVYRHGRRIVEFPFNRGGSAHAGDHPRAICV